MYVYKHFKYAFIYNETKCILTLCVLFKIVCLILAFCFIDIELYAHTK